MSENLSPPMESLVITQDMLESAKTKRGGYSGAQMRYLAKVLGLGSCKGWKKKSDGREIPKEYWIKFEDLAQKTRGNKPDKKSKRLNPMSTKKDSFWKPEQKDIPPLRSKGNKNQGKKRAKKQRLKGVSPRDFYISREWRTLRVRVLEKFECKCMMCGRSPKEHGVVIHVDHIEPRSKRPDLELEITNMQLLCEECNKGKSNKYNTDWRPDEREDLDEEEQELEIVAAARERL